MKEVSECRCATQRQVSHSSEQAKTIVLVEILAQLIEQEQARTDFYIR